MSEHSTSIRYLGGESGHRSFFGGTHSKTRVTLLGLSILAGMVLTPIVGWIGLLIGVGGCGITLLLTARTHRGSIMERRTKRARWKKRITDGTATYRPYSVAEWDQLEQALLDARSAGRHGRTDAGRLQRTLSQMRANPDGCDGMGWLQMGRGEPGIQWHAPVGEPAYLAVAFSVTGQLRGIESMPVMNRAAASWGSFLATRAVPSVLVSEVQTLTRVMPSDSALQEFWVLNSLDADAPQDAVASYEDVLRLSGQDAMIQRHAFIVKWPLGPAFYDAASKYGIGRDGWRGLMREEIESTLRGLRDARMGAVEALTARQVTAQILHQQNPSRPIDFVADVHPGAAGVASHDEFSAHIVDGIDPVTGDAVQWWHRTAAIRAEHLTVAPRTQLWMLDFLIGSDLKFTRSISFDIHLVPAGEAKNAAKQDLTRDRAAQLADRDAGRLIDDDGRVALSAAARRKEDLTAGSHHHGASWVGYVTITTRSRDELARASRQLSEVCASGLGIERLEWLDSYQSAASGTTWPIGRGLATPKRVLSTRFYDQLAGKSAKEAIS